MSQSLSSEYFDTTTVHNPTCAFGECRCEYVTNWLNAHAKYLPKDAREPTPAVFMATNLQMYYQHRQKEDPSVFLPYQVPARFRVPANTLVSVPAAFSLYMLPSHALEPQPATSQAMLELEVPFTGQRRGQYSPDGRFQSPCSWMCPRCI